MKWKHGAILLVLAVLLGFLAPHLLPGTWTGEETPGSLLKDRESLPDLTNVRPVRQRKRLFFRFLLPLVQRENGRIEAIRTRLGYIQDQIRHGKSLPASDREWLMSVRARFQVDLEDPGHPEFWTLLLERVDTVPEDLVLIQAANESAWGTSRFAREGNNLFGQWCFRPGCGMVPEGRSPGQTHEVARFDSCADAIAAYLRNLNTGRAYEDLRGIRARLRAEGQTPTAEALAGGLLSYSQRGQAYVDDLLKMLRTNGPIIEKVRSSLSPEETRTPEEEAS